MRIGVPWNRQNALNPPPLSSKPNIQSTEYKHIAMLLQRTGVRCANSTASKRATITHQERQKI